MAIIAGSVHILLVCLILNMLSSQVFFQVICVMVINLRTSQIFTGLANLIYLKVLTFCLLLFWRIWFSPSSSTRVLTPRDVNVSELCFPPLVSHQAVKASFQIKYCLRPARLFNILKRGLPKQWKFRQSGIKNGISEGMFSQWLTQGEGLGAWPPKSFFEFMSLLIQIIKQNLFLYHPPPPKKRIPTPPPKKMQRPRDFYVLNQCITFILSHVPLQQLLRQLLQQLLNFQIFENLNFGLSWLQQDYIFIFWEYSLTRKS